MASTYLTRTFQASNRRTYTFSAWVKRSDITSSYQYLFDCDNGSTQSENPIALNLNKFNFSLWNTSANNSPFTVNTNRLLRDTNAWYHLVCAVDTTQATASDRIKLYINGVQETSLATASYPSQNYDTAINTANVHSIGRWQDGGSRYFGGLMSYVAFVDGQQLTPSTFGETDSTTGEWKIKTTITPGGTGWGTNGFFILKDGNSVTDQSGQGNNWTVGGGTLTKTEDCPSNVFATINPLDFYYGGQASGSLSNSNTKIQTAGSGVETYTLSTLGASSGKYYCEMKLVSSTAAHQTRFGIAYEPTNSTTDWLGKRDVGWSLRQDGTPTNNNSTISGTFASYTAGDIVSMAIDLDNSKLYFRKNNDAWMNSGDPTSGSTGTGAISITAGKTYLIGIGDETGGYSVCELNFGNGYFGTTAVSSAGANASGNGIFEYDVPTGYTALSTKGLNL